MTPPTHVTPSAKGNAMHYIAQIHTDAPGIGFTIEDLPGFAAHVETDDLDVALAEAQTVLRDYIAAMVDTGQPVPEARPMAEVMKAIRAEAEEGEEIAVIAMRAILPAGRTIRANLSLDEHVLNLIDSESKARGLTRSAYVTAAAYAFAGVSNPLTSGWAGTRCSNPVILCTDPKDYPDLAEMIEKAFRGIETSWVNSSNGPTHLLSNIYVADSQTLYSADFAAVPNRKTRKPAKVKE